MNFLYLNLVLSRPTRKKILKHVVPHVIDQWYEIGLMLLNEDDESDLNAIKSDNATVTNCCNAMFWLWLDKSADATWQNLIEALKTPSVGLSKVADDLKRMLTGRA